MAWLASMKAVVPGISSCGALLQAIEGIGNAPDLALDQLEPVPGAVECRIALAIKESANQMEIADHDREPSAGVMEVLPGAWCCWA